MASICLVGIVRDERQNLPILFNSLRHLLDAIVLTDTGSKDETVSYVKKYLEDEKLPGEISESSWKGFPVSRTESFINAEGFLKKLDIRQKMKRNWYFMLMDADDIAYEDNNGVPGGLPKINKSTLTEIGYSVSKFQDQNNPKFYPFYWLLRVEKTRKWTWKRRIHEYPVLDGKEINLPLYGGCLVKSGRRGFRSRNPYTYAEDACEAIKEYVDVKDGWSAYQVAQSYKDQGIWQLAIPMYKETIKIDPYAERSYQASMEILRYLIFHFPSVKDPELKQKRLQKIVNRAMKTIELNPQRLEAPYHLIKAYRLAELHNSGYAIGKGFLGIAPNFNLDSVMLLDYTFRIYDEMAICASAINQKKDAIEWIKKALEEKRAPDESRKRLVSNLYKLQTSSQKTSLAAEGDKFTPIEEKTTAEAVLEKLLKDGKYDLVEKKLDMPNELSTYSQYLLAAARFGLNKKDEALKMIDKILDQAKCTSELLDLITGIREKILTPRFKKYIDYPAEIIKQISERDTSDASVTFTMTTCKRFDLFVQTMNSFIQCCTELDQIREWIIVDDNSNNEDRRKMKELYPFANFIFKNFKHKGHPISMEILRLTVKTRYIIHIEDDWNFVMPFPFISRAMDVLQTDEKYLAVCFNRNSAELLSEHRTETSDEKWSKNNYRYHEHIPGVGKQGHWPSFSLRPGLFRMSSLHQLGTFLLPGHFEHAYGLKADSLGLKYCYLPGIYAQTTGRLTAETHKSNSYTLNKEDQNNFDPSTVPPLDLPMTGNEKNLNLREKVRKIENLTDSDEILKLIEGDHRKIFFPYYIRALIEKGQVGLPLTDINKFLLTTSCSSETLSELGRLRTSLLEKYPPLVDYPEKIVKTMRLSPLENKQTFTHVVCLVLEKQAAFEKTLNSFINCCLDLEKIDSWIVVSDDSEVIVPLKEKYPFLSFIVRTGGEMHTMHPIEVLRQRISTKYLLFLEPGWIFSTEVKYFTVTQDILESDPKLGQVMLNRNYAILLSEYDTEIGPEKFSISQRYRYFEHIRGRGRHGHWPHFSIQPALHRKEVWDSVGEFIFSRNYEEEYAHRYSQKGYSTAFLPLITCVKAESSSPKIFETSSVQKDELRVKSFCINLDRRKDRWETVKTEFTREDWPIERFSATDGKELTLTPAQARMFKNNEFYSRRTVVGCAMSHYRLWDSLVDDDDADAYLIFEDDIKLAKDFKKKLEKVIKQVTDQDVVYLAYHIWNDKRTSEYINLEAPDVTFEDMGISSYGRLKEFSPGGAQSYLLTKKAASFLLEKAEEDGMKKANDDFINFYHHSLKIWHCKPHLTHSEYCDFRNGNKPKTDSNIQYDLDPVKIYEVPRVKSFIINLARRKDRWQKMQSHLEEFRNVERFEAVDGKTVKLTEKEKKIFTGNDHNWRAGVIGCALSHLRLWEKLTKEKNIDAYLVYEDDIELSSQFSRKIDSLLDNYAGQDFILLASHFPKMYRNSETHNLSSNAYNIVRWKYTPKCVGGTQGYMISKEGARKLLKIVSEKGMKRAVDGFLLDYLPSLDTWECLPHLLFSEYYQEENHDTDIQKDYTEVKR